MQHGFFQVDLSVPASTSGAAWNATATLLGQRLKIARTGVRADGGTWNVADLIRFRVRVDPALPTEARKQPNALLAKHAAFVTEGPFDWEGVANQQSATMAAKKRPAAAAAADGPAPRKRPARR